MPDEVVIIVDANGTEHEFPPGFDPKRAAGIVRDATALHAVGNDETDNPMLAAIGGFGKGAVAGMTGFAKGVGNRIAHPIDTAGNIIGGAGREALDTLTGTGHLLTDPKQTLTNAGNAVLGMPHAIAQGVSDELDKGPEAVGRDIGGATADTMTGIGLAGGIRLAPVPVARTTGQLMQTVGARGAWPLRIMGAHQLGSGNPMGIATIMMPEQLKRGGEALERWATEPGALAATPESLFLQVKQDLAGARQTGDAATLSRLADQLDKMQADLVTKRQRAKLPIDIADANKAQTRIDQLRKGIDTVTKGQQKIEATSAKAAQEAERLRLINAAKQGLEPSDPRITERMSATGPNGTKQSMSRTFSPPEEAFGGTTPEAPPTPARPIPGRVIAPDPETTNPNYVPGGPVRPPIRVAAPAPQPQAPLTPGTTLEAPSAIVSPAARDAAVQAFNERFGTGGAPPIRIAPETASTLERTAKVPVEGNVPGSKSRGGAMSATPGLTIADAEALGLNPNIKITGLTPEAIKTLLDARANRASSYRINKGLDAAATRATDLEP